MRGMHIREEIQELNIYLELKEKMYAVHQCVAEWEQQCHSLTVRRQYFAGMTI